MKEIDKSSGSPYACGLNDAYQKRIAFPHKWPKGSGIGQPIVNLTVEEQVEYLLGFNQQTKFKDWE